MRKEMLRACAAALFALLTLSGMSAGREESPVKLGFTNPAAGDFSLQRKARLTQEMPAFKPPPVDKIGLYKDQYRRRLPAP